MPHNGIIKMLGCGIDRDARLTPCDDLETQTEEAEEEWSWSWCPSVITMQLSVTIKTATTQKFNWSPRTGGVIVNFHYVISVTGPDPESNSDPFSSLGLLGDYGEKWRQKAEKLQCFHYATHCIFLLGFPVLFISAFHPPTGRAITPARIYQLITFMIP